MNKKSWGLRALRWAITVLLIGCTLVVMASFAMKQGDAMLHFTQAVKHARPYLIAMHFSLIAMLWWQWSALVRWIATKREWTPSREAGLNSLRNQLVCMLCILEIVVVVRPQSWL